MIHYLRRLAEYVLKDGRVVAERDRAIIDVAKNLQELDEKLNPGSPEVSPEERLKRLQDAARGIPG